MARRRSLHGPEVLPDENVRLSLNAWRSVIARNARDIMPRTKDEEARELAEKHYQVEAGLTRVIRISRSASVEICPDEPIKLLEVNENTVPSGIMPIQFGPSPASGLDYPTVIVEVTPDEYEKIRTGELRLPDGWTLGEEIPKTNRLEGQ
jgi:hypothetical protein